MRKSAKRSFKPSVDVLIRIISILTQKRTVGRTLLCLEGHLNYTRASRHLRWLADKEFIEFVVENGKVKIRLTDRGRNFADLLLK
ncbi:MAG: winged helix-turn-helix domain-containing protein [Nitrososphaera sp.]